MTLTDVISIAGICISLLAKYVPEFNTWYAVRNAFLKALIMVGAVAVVLGCIIGIVCLGLYDFGFACTKVDIAIFLRTMGTGLVYNLMAYFLFPETNAVKLAKLDNQQKVLKKLRA